MKSGATMYTAKGQLDLNSTLKQYSGLVRRLAHQMIAKLPANVEIDDLIQVGMIGLTDALSRFDAAQGVQFETSCAATTTSRAARASTSARSSRRCRGSSSSSAARRRKARSPRRWASA
jgi:DNA-directed RNA polymerase specialized sigma subunit